MLRSFVLRRLGGPQGRAVAAPFGAQPGEDAEAWLGALWSDSEGPVGRRRRRFGQLHPKAGLRSLTRTSLEAPGRITGSYAFIGSKLCTRLGSKLALQAYVKAESIEEAFHQHTLEPSHTHSARHGGYGAQLDDDPWEGLTDPFRCHVERPGRSTTTCAARPMRSRS